MSKDTYSPIPAHRLPTPPDRVGKRSGKEIDAEEHARLDRLRAEPPGPLRRGLIRMGQLIPPLAILAAYVAYRVGELRTHQDATRLVNELTASRRARE